MVSQGRVPGLSRRAFLGSAGAAGALMGGADGPAPAGGPPRAPMRGRKEELARRVAALDLEIAEWVRNSESRTDEKGNNSQLIVLQAMMGRFVGRQRDLLKGIDPAGDLGTFEDGVQRLTGEILRAQRVWEYFRTIFLTRSSPTLREPILAAEAVAWDCHRTILLKAASFGAIAEAHFREPPLCYPTAVAGPGTWAREQTPLGLADQEFRLYKTPIPVILLPWESLRNAWELVAIHHEVGHVIEAELKLEGPLAVAIGGVEGIPPERARRWAEWGRELFADLVGLRLGGAAFAEMLAYELLGPPDQVLYYNPADPAHPTPYARILMNAAYLRTLAADEPGPGDDGAAEMGRVAAEIEARWRGFYGEPPQSALDFLKDFTAVSRAMTGTKLAALKGRTLRDLIPYESKYDRAIRERRGDAARRRRAGCEDRPAARRRRGPAGGEPGDRRGARPGRGAAVDRCGGREADHQEHAGHGPRRRPRTPPVPRRLRRRLLTRPAPPPKGGRP